MTFGMVLVVLEVVVGFFVIFSVVLVIVSLSPELFVK